MLVYLARPIDQATDTWLNRVASQIEQTLLVNGISIYKPAGAFKLNNPDRPDRATVQRINQCALTAADALVAWLPPGVPTLGVPAEIEEALRWDKPTVILTTEGMMGVSVQLTDWEDRGAAVYPWTERTARNWGNNGTQLLTSLGIRPSLMLGESPVSTLPLVSVPPTLEMALDPAATHPNRAYQDDAGFDLAIIEDTKLEPGEYKLIRTGVRAAVPSGWWGMITGRSSTWAKYRCDVRQAVIDAGYRGELMIGLENRGDSAVKFEAGMRLAQYVLIPTFPGHAQVVEQLPESHRGEAGYGSSGS